MNTKDWFNVAANKMQSEVIAEHFNPIESYPISTLQAIKNELRHYEECNYADEREYIEYINYLIKNCIIIDKNKLLKMIHREKLFDLSNLTDTYKYSLAIERIIKIGKHSIPTGEKDLFLKELDERVYQEFIKYFKEHLEVEDKY